MSRFFAACLLVALATAAFATAQPVQIKVASAGFEAGVMSRFVVRCGQWTPILVELDALGSQPMQLTLRCERADLDGDRVEYLETPVTVTPGAGTKRAWLYASIALSDADQGIVVDVLDDQGALLTRCDPLPFELVSDDYQLVLDLGEAPLDALRRIDSGSGDYVDTRLGQRPYYRGVCVARLRARDLPDAWFGLEAVDVAVWDEADPDQLSPAQAEALVEWVRRGGQLVIGTGAAWPRLRQSPLAELLPLEDGRVVEVDVLPQFFREFVPSDVTRFANPVAIVVGPPRADARTILRDEARGRAVELLTLRSVGAGRVIVCAARLRDLLNTGDGGRLLERLIDLNPNTDAFLAAEAERLMLRSAVSLHRPLVAPVEFRGQASLLVLAAFIFVGGYIAASTIGSWLWLQRKQRTHWSWSIFAAFAVLASLLSIGAVRLMRGVSESLHTVSFVDLEAGAAAASAHVLAGYKSPVRQRADLRVAGEGGTLRPLEPLSYDAQYATPERYQALPRKGQLLDAPMRATLKQFEAYWRGALPGTVRAQLAADRRTGQITPTSWVANDLQVDIEDAWLLYIDPRLRALDGVPARVAGLTRRTDRQAYLGHRVVPPAVNVLVARLGPIAHGQRVAQIHAREYARYQQDLLAWRQSAERPDPAREPMLATLWHMQTTLWMNSLKPQFTPFTSKLDATHAAALMASTRNLFLHSDPADFDRPDYAISTRGVPNLDVTHWLIGGRREGQAVLLLYAAAPGPTRLVKGDDELPARRGVCLYRVRVPIGWQN